MLRYTVISRSDLPEVINRPRHGKCCRLYDLEMDKIKLNRDSLSRTCHRQSSGEQGDGRRLRVWGSRGATDSVPVISHFYCPSRTCTFHKFLRHSSTSITTKVSTKQDS